MENANNNQEQTPKGLNIVGFVNLDTDNKKQTLKIHKNKGLAKAALTNAAKNKAKKEAETIESIEAKLNKMCETARKIAENAATANIKTARVKQKEVLELRNQAKELIKNSKIEHNFPQLDILRLLVNELYHYGSEKYQLEKLVATKFKK